MRSSIGTSVVIFNFELIKHERFTHCDCQFFCSGFIAPKENGLIFMLLLFFFRENQQNFVNSHIIKHDKEFVKTKTLKIKCGKFSGDFSKVFSDFPTCILAINFSRYNELLINCVAEAIKFSRKFFSSGFSFSTSGKFPDFP